MRVIGRARSSTTDFPTVTERSFAESWLVGPTGCMTVSAGGAEGLATGAGACAAAFVAWPASVAACALITMGKLKEDAKNPKLAMRTQAATFTVAPRVY